MEDINSMFANSAAPTTISELTTIMEKISTHFTKETQELRDVVTALRDRVEALEGKLEGQQAPVDPVELVCKEIDHLERSRGVGSDDDTIARSLLKPREGRKQCLSEEAFTRAWTDGVIGGHLRATYLKDSITLQVMGRRE